MIYLINGLILGVIGLIMLVILLRMPEGRKGRFITTIGTILGLALLHLGLGIYIFFQCLTFPTQYADAQQSQEMRTTLVINQQLLIYKEAVENNDEAFYFNVDELANLPYLETPIDE